MNLAPQIADHGAGAAQGEGDLRVLFHRLNNQLGIILAHAELMEVNAATLHSPARSVFPPCSCNGTARESNNRSRRESAVQNGTYAPVSPSCCLSRERPPKI